MDLRWLPLGPGFARSHKAKQQKQKGSMCWQQRALLLNMAWANHTLRGRLGTNHEGQGTSPLGRAGGRNKGNSQSSLGELVGC